MPAITALLHTHNDGLRLGRCLETLYPCDDIVIVDHGSDDWTLRVAREYGACILGAAESIPDSARGRWILCLDPRESLTEALAASLFEWKSETLAGQSAFSMFLREETAEGWVQNPEAQTRLVPANWSRWEGHFPAPEKAAVALEGELLRFVLP
jgi:cellulose synthase/poly-beta-1,6-N-acetylglucosamine synthase-like glycosyltransferase